MKKENNASLKLEYTPPTLDMTLIEMEYGIAADSIQVNPDNNQVQESWMVEDDINRDVDLDFFN